MTGQFGAIDSETDGETFQIRRGAIQMPDPVSVSDVFGIRVHVNPRSYVDRGSLDEHLKSLLSADTHIVIHGDSKQGKSWLRSRVLSSNQTIVIQCQPGATPEQILKEALGSLGVFAEISRTKTGAYEGTLEISGTAGIGIKILASLGLTAKAAGKKSRQDAFTSEPVGRTPGDLNWVAKVLAASDRRLVIEDFHYVSEENRRDAAFLIKALGDYGVFVIIVGIWPHDHLLSYYNGDLEGRIEDIHLQWFPGELEHVLELGAEHLGITFSPNLRETLVRDAYGNVGLLQRLAKAICIEEGVLHARSDALFITQGQTLDSARASVANSMRARYESFADNFVQGLRRLKKGLEVYRHLLQVVTEATDEDLESGLPRNELLQRIKVLAAGQIQLSDLTSALQRLDRLQVKIGVKPLVLTYSRDSQKLWIVDKSFLFFRRYGNPNWPWNETDFSIVNDLASRDPLDVS